MKNQIKILLTASIMMVAYYSVNAQQNSYDLNTGNGNGIRFWNSNLYKIHMGIGSEYQYGPVTDHSVKFNMTTSSGTRGWTWGQDGQVPKAALSSLGHMQIAGNFTLENSSYLYMGSVNDRIKADNGNIGIYPNANLYIGAVVGGAETKNVTFLENGNVGVGTASPSYKLHVYDGKIAQSILGNSSQWYYLILSGGHASGIWANNGNPALYLRNTSGNLNTVIRPDGTSYLNGGNVGIGTASPQRALHVHSSGWDNQLLLQRSGHTTGFSMMADNNDVYFYKVAGIGSTETKTPLMVFKQASGNVGIGTTTPSRLLHIKNDTGWAYGKIEGGIDASAIFELANDAQTWQIQTRDDDVFTIRDKTSNARRLTIDLNGNVGIGTTNTFGYKLAVNGTIGSKEVKVEVSSAWPDYVFSKNYKLKSLAETESYIKEEGHLPNIPSAEEVSENGIELGDMNARLLEKIEELTLHLINQQKEIDALKAEVRSMR